ncbi:carboxymuconolactone decarboxylase family protein [Thalassospira australica]|uniref:carboxymuconolactone decarboxylase family protein n=1 Tax=Thalassospira australica TaxID=1528106 RepID=UPI00384CF3A9
MRLNFISPTLPAAAFLFGIIVPAHADQRMDRGEAVIDTLTNGQGQPALENMRRHFPFLADATVGYALGDVWGRSTLDHRTRQLATVAAFAATGHIPYMQIHARYALNMGATPDELREIVYLTTVHAGFPAAINAASGLTELFDELEIDMPVSE